MIFDKGASDVRIVFEVVEGSWIHRRKTFEELLVAVEMLIVNLDIVSLFDPI